MNATSGPDIAYIPLSLTETLQPEDRAGLLNAAQEDGCTVTTILVRALKEYLKRPKPARQMNLPLNPQPEGLTA